MSDIDPSWKPNESEATLFNERAWLNGMLICGVAYGVALMLFILAFTHLVKTTTKHNLSMRLPYLIYITVIIILGTCYVAALAKMNELSFIDARLFPGGPEAFAVEEISVPIDVMACVANILGNWMADGMLLYRFMIIFGNCGRPLWLVMPIPVLSCLATMVLSVLWVIEIATALPSQIPQSPRTNIDLVPPYFWMSLSLNIVLSLAIVSRLLLFRWRISSVLGPSHGTQYTSVAAIIVESALLYSVFAILFVIPFGLNSGIGTAFLRLFGEVQIIAPLLIAYRVARGNAWVANTSTALATQVQNNSADVRVNVELSTHRDKPPPSRGIFSKPEISQSGVGTDYEMGQV